MDDFSTFYQLGGAFNHVVSLLALAALVLVVTHALAPAPAKAPLRLLRLADRLTALCVLTGLLGLMFNLMDLGAALATVEGEQILQAGSRGLAIVPIPLAWSLMCAIPLWLASLLYGQRASLA
jgi:hypothetical protein